MGRKRKKRSFTIPRYGGRTVESLTIEDFKSPEAFHYARRFFGSILRESPRIFGRTNQQRRSFIFVIKNLLLSHNPTTHSEFLSRVQRPKGAMRRLLEEKGDAELRTRDRVAKLITNRMVGEHVYSVKTTSPNIDWLNEPINAKLLPDQLVSHYHDYVRRFQNVEGGAIKNKQVLLRDITNAIAWKGLMAVRGRRNLSLDKLRKYHRELASIEYNRLLLVQRGVNNRALSEAFREWEELAFGHLVAEYGIGVGERYGLAAKRVREQFENGIATLSNNYKPFARLWGRQIPVNEIKFPWIWLPDIRKLRHRLKPHTLDTTTGRLVRDESLPFLLDWKHFKLTHPLERTRRRKQEPTPPPWNRVLIKFPKVRARGLALVRIIPKEKRK